MHAQLAHMTKETSNAAPAKSGAAMYAMQLSYAFVTFTYAVDCFRCAANKLTRQTRRKSAADLVLADLQRWWKSLI